MTRREKILVLLDNYLDVINGLRDVSLGDGVIGMCRSWNFPPNGYPELERLRVLLRDNMPVCYWHLAETYFRGEAKPARVCPHCWDSLKRRDEFWAPHAGPDFHRHAGRSVATVIRPVRRVSAAVDPRLVSEAVDWLEERWTGEPFIPDDVLTVVNREAA